MRAAIALAAGLLVLVAACTDDDGAGDPAETVRFTRADHEATLTVEIADESDERTDGLSNRATLDKDSGMLFVFADDTSTGFTMRETTIPLSIAFVTAGGVIIDIQDMEPLAQEPYRSPEPFRYAIEVNQGWFEDNDVRVGDIVQLPVGVGV
jgi:uncharacterized membrane protein (UPF0127 family)